MADIEPMKLDSEDLVVDRIEQLKQLFPEIATEGNGSVDFEKLRLIMGDEVNEDDERYAFFWPGKRDAIRQAQMTSSATLRPAVDESRSREGVDGSFDSDNLYIEGDNLEVLKLLQHSYHGKVKMIYVDPPYNTGHDFVYKDSFGDTIKNYKQQAGLSGQSNADTSGRYHSDWCSMIYPRIKLARELLADNGVFFISIDDNEERNLRAICDEIFGEESFLARFIWRKVDSPNDNHVVITPDHEYILAYCKNVNHLNLKQREAPELVDAYNGPDDAGRYWRDRLLRKNGKNSLRSDRPTMFYPLTAPDGTAVFPIREDGREGCWAAGLKTVTLLDEQGDLIWKQRGNAWVPYTREYASDSPTKPWMTIWNDLPAMRQTKAGIKELFDVANVFDTPKPPQLIERCMALAGVGPSDIVLDFFSGSGSAAHATIEYCASVSSGVRWIAVQIPEPVGKEDGASHLKLDTICEVGKERIRRAGAKIAAEIEESNKQLKIGEDPNPIPDIGFRVFKLDESGINRQDLNAAVERGKLFGGDSLLDSVVKPNRSDMDIIFEMMLKWGLELTLPVEVSDVEGYKCYQVAGGELVCCMEAGLTVAVLETIARMDPRRVLMLDSILTDSLKLNAVQFFKRVSERTGVNVELRTV